MHHPDGVFLLEATVQWQRQKLNYSLCNKNDSLVTALKMSGVLCEPVSKCPDLAWGQKAFLCGSDQKEIERMERN